MIARESDKRLQNVRFNCVNAKQNTYAIADEKISSYIIFIPILKENFQ